VAAEDAVVAAAEEDTAAATDSVATDSAATERVAIALQLGPTCALLREIAQCQEARLNPEE